MDIIIRPVIANQAFLIQKKGVDSPAALKQLAGKVFNDKYKHI